MRDPFWPWLGLIAAVPLTLVGDGPWVSNGAGVAAGALLLWWGIVSMRPTGPRPASWRRHGLTTLAACAVLGWIAVQMIPDAVPAWNHPLWRDAATALGAPIGGAISLDPAATGDALVRLMGYVAVFWLAMQFGQHPGRARQVLWVVAATGAAIALAAVLLRYAEQSVGSATLGPWAGLIRPGLPALYLGMCAIAALALASWPAAARPRRFDRGHLEALVPLTMLGLIVTALLASRSPSELVCAVVAFGAFTAMRLSGSGVRIGASLSAGMAAGAGAMGAVLVGGWLSGWSLAGQGEPRIDRLAQALRAIGDTPLTGQGLGTFGAGFHLYHEGSLVWLAASPAGTPSAFVELALGAGVAAATVLLATFAWLATASIRGIRSRDGGAIGPAAALSVTVLLGCHAAFATGLEHPAVAVPFAALLGIGFVGSWPAGAALPAKPGPDGGPREART